MRTQTMYRNQWYDFYEFSDILMVLFLLLQTAIVLCCCWCYFIHNSSDSDENALTSYPSRRIEQTNMTIIAPVDSRDNSINSTVNNFSFSSRRATGIPSGYQSAISNPSTPWLGLTNLNLRNSMESEEVFRNEEGDHMKTEKMRKLLKDIDRSRTLYRVEVHKRPDPRRSKSSVGCNYVERYRIDHPQK